MYGHGKHIVIVDVYNDTDGSNKITNGRSEEEQTVPNLLRPAANDFVTLVKVDEPNLAPCPGYVTVLQVTDGLQEDGTEEITIYRLPGERLGMALKFEGGINAADNVSRVFIQSINMDSPAARAQCALGPLQEGDEILKIDGREVSSMTRMDCVSLLRHAPVCIRMVVRRQTVNEECINEEEHQEEEEMPVLSKKKKGPPPPIPPRKSPSRIDQDIETIATVREVVQRLEERTINAERNSIKRPVHPPPLPPRRPKTTVFVEDFDNTVKPNFPGASLSTKLPGWEELLMRRAGKLDDCNLPAKADIYMDVIAEEDEKQMLESESDDTGSSVSTVIERFSRTSTANSSFSEHTHAIDRTTYDLNQVLSPFEQLERELDGEVSDDPQQIAPENITIDPPESFQDVANIDTISSEPELQECSEDNLESENNGENQDYSSDELNGEISQSSSEFNDSKESSSEEISSNKKVTPPPVPPRRTKIECSPRIYTGTSKIPRPTHRKPSSSPKSSPSPSSKIPSNPLLWKRRRIECSSTVTKSVKTVRKDKSVSIQAISTSQGFREESKSLKTSSKEVSESKTSGYVSTAGIVCNAKDNQITAMESNSSGINWDSGWQCEEKKLDSSSTDSEAEQTQKDSEMRLKNDDDDEEEEKEEENEECREEKSNGYILDTSDSIVQQDDVQECAIEEDNREDLFNVEKDSTTENNSLGLDSVLTETHEEEKSMEEIPVVKDETETNYGNELEKGEEKMEVVPYPDEQFLPPTVFRQPPDGDEFPPNYTEPVIIENRLEDSGVFLEDAVKVTSNQYVIYPMDIPDGKFKNTPEEKSLAALDELIHGKSHQVVQEMQVTTEKEGGNVTEAEQQEENVTRSETLYKSENVTNVDKQEMNTVNSDANENVTETELNNNNNNNNNNIKAKENENNNSIDPINIPKPKVIHEKMKNGHTIATTENVDEKKHNYGEINNRWKSEENLRNNRISSRFSRNNETQQVSVKDRIAMFSRSEISLNQETIKSSQNKGDNIKESPKIDLKASNGSNTDFNLKDCKWHSTGNISSTAGIKEKNEINNNKDMTSSLISIPNEISSEQSNKKPDIISSYPQTQWLRYQRYSYGGYNYPRRLEDCYKRFSSGSLFSPLDKKQSKLKGLIIPEKPTIQPTVNKSLPTIVSCSSVLLNKLDVPKTVQNYSNLRTENVLSIDNKETDISSDKKYNFSQIMDMSWKQTNAMLPKYSPAFKRKSLQLSRTTNTPSISPTPPSSLTSPLSPSPPSSICSSNSSCQKQDVFQLPAETSETNDHDNLGSNGSYLANRFQDSISGKYLAQPVAISESKTYESSELNSKNVKTRTSKMEEWSAISRWARQTEQDDDSTSSTSQQTEDSRHLADDSMSETNSDSEFRPRFLSHQKTVLRMPSDTTDSVRNFRALAEKWAQRSGDSSDALSPTPMVSPTHTLKKETGRRGSQDNGTKLPPSLKPRSSEITESTVKLREEKPKLVRPTSLVDNPRCTGGLKKLEYAESCESLTRLTNRSRDYKSRHSGIDTSSRSLSVSDIRKTFESTAVQQNGIKSNGFKKSVQQPELKRMPIDHSRMSSIDSNCSERSNISLETSDLTVVLKKPHATGSIGITLAGGIDCEVRDITIHKVIAGSIADRDGRLRKGDRILEVNSQPTDGLTHRDVQALLKLPCTEMELVVLRVPDRIHCQDSSQNLEANVTIKNDSNGNNQRHLSVELQKEGTGLGFGIEGGKDSPLGDRPLIIKRIFKGGAADREGTLKAGDELISVNGQSLNNMTRTEAWNYMKKLPDGLVTLTVQVS